MRHRARPFLSIGGILSLILILAPGALSQPEYEWIIRHDLPNRYEGIVSITVGAPLLELIAFYFHRDVYSWNDNLRVWFYLDQAPRESSNVSLTARELEPRIYYWMEARQQWTRGWNNFHPWPVSDFLKRYQIPAKNLGVLVKIRDQIGINKISPAGLFRTSSSPQIERYTAYFRPGNNLAGGRYELYRGCSGNTLIETGLLGQQNAGVPFPVIFHLPNASAKKVPTFFTKELIKISRCSTRLCTSMRSSKTTSLIFWPIRL